LRRLNGLAKRLAFSTRLNTMTQTNDKRWLHPEAYLTTAEPECKVRRWRDILPYGSWRLAFVIAVVIYWML